MDAQSAILITKAVNLKMNQDRELKKEIVSIISLHMGQKVAHRFDSFYHSDNPQRLLTSADNMLSEFLGRRKAGEYLSQLYNKFAIKRY